MSRLTLIKDYITNDEVLAGMAVEERYAEIADSLNSLTVTKLGFITPAWFLTFLGIEGLWIKLVKLSIDDNLPDDNMIKNASAILVNYLQSGNTNPIDFSIPETKLILDGFLSVGVITQLQHDKVIARCSYQAPFVVETWGGSLTSADEVREALSS